jgi:outer membrane biosynthesis protein TonB
MAALPEPAPQPEPEPESEPELEPEPEQQVQPAPPPPSKPRVRMAQEDKPKEETKQFSSILNNVLEMKDQDSPPREAEEKSDREPAPQQPQVAMSERMTISEIDAIRRQIERCWNVPAGARDAENLVVEIRLMLNPDGSVMRAEVLDAQRMARDSFYRTAAESALRAVRRCSPLQAPPRKYEVWKEITLTFNPKEMFGT